MQRIKGIRVSRSKPIEYEKVIKSVPEFVKKHRTLKGDASNALNMT